MKWIVTVIFCMQGIVHAYSDTLEQNAAFRIAALEEQLKDAALNSKPAIYNRIAEEYLAITPGNSIRYARNSLNLSVISDNKTEEALAYFILGKAYYRLNDYDKSFMNLETSMEIETNLHNPERLSDIYLTMGKVQEEMNNYDSAKYYINRSFEIEVSLGNESRLSDRYKTLGDIYHISGNPKDAMEYFRKSLDIEQKNDHTYNIANLHNRIGNVFLDLGNYEKALEYYLQSLKTMEELNNRQGKAHSLNNIGIVYYDWGDKQRALEYYLQSMQIEREINNEKGLAGSYNNLGIIYCDWGQHDLAIEYYKKSLEINKKYGDKKGISQTMSNIGESYFEMGKHNEALGYMIEGLEAEKQMNHLPGVSNSYATIGKAFYKLGEYRKALRYNDSSYRIAHNLGLTGIVFENYKLYTDIYAGLGELDRAYNYLKKVTQLKDTIYNNNFIDQIARIQMKFDVDKIEQEKETLVKQFTDREQIIQRQKIYLAIIFISLVIIMLIITYDTRIKRRANKRLKQINEQLRHQKEKFVETLSRLQTSEEKYKKLVKYSPTGILFIDTNGNILEVNDKMLEILGSPGEEQTKQINCLRFPALKEAGLSDDILRSIRTKETVYNESSYKSKWGKSIKVRYFITPLKDDQNNVNNLLLNFEDITLRQEAEEALRKSEIKYKNLIENSLQGIFVLQNNMVSFANSKMSDLTLYSMDELTDASTQWYELFVHPDDKKKARLLGEQGLQDKRSGEVRFLRKDGTSRWIKILVSPLDQTGSVSSVVVAMDISGHKASESVLRESEKKLKDANATKDRFFSIIAHDLRNPFNAIIGFSNLLLSSYDTLNETEKKNIIQNISEASERTFKLLQNLLDWAQTQTGQIEFRPAVIDLCILVNEINSTLKSGAESKNITVTSKVPFNTLVKADEDMIRTVLRNIISNAIKFSYPNGHVTVIANPTDDKVTVCVKDNGIGMNETMASSIFNPDHKFKRNGTANETGTGLGLILCKEFVEQNGGSIWVESQENQGSRFYFTLSLPD